MSKTNSSAAATRTDQVLLETFAHRLRLIRRANGDPSYREIAHRAGRSVTSISITSISRILNGQARPTWRMTEALLTGCGIDQQTINNVWRPRWRQLQEALQPIGDEVRAEPLVPEQSPGIECVRCGAWVSNADQHGMWHDQLERVSLPGHPLRSVRSGTSQLRDTIGSRRAS